MNKLLTNEEFDLIKNVPFDLVRAEGWERLKTYAADLKNDVQVRDARINLNAEVIKENIKLQEENKKLKSMIEHGIGFEDLINDH